MIVQKNYYIDWVISMRDNMQHNMSKANACLAILIFIAVDCNILYAQEFRLKKPISPAKAQPVQLKLTAPTAAPTVFDPGDKVNSGDEFLIRWTKVDGASGYDTQIAIDSIFTKRLIDSGMIGGDSTEAHFLKDATEITTYYFRVRAKNNAGSGPWSNIVDITVMPRPEYLPINASPSATGPSHDINSGDEFLIRWTKVEGATGYDTQIAIDSAFTRRLISSGMKGGNSTEVYFMKDPKELTIYYFRVCAKNYACLGPWSNIVEVTVVPIDN